MTNKLKTLREIGEDLLALDALIDEIPGGDITAVDSTIDLWWAQTTADLTEKIDRYLCYAAALEDAAASRQAEADRLTGLVAVGLARRKRLLARLHEQLVSIGMAKVETAHYVVTRAKNGGALPVIVEPLLLAAEWYAETITRRPDIARIRDALEADAAAVPGAKLGDRGEHLRIK